MRSPRSWRTCPSRRTRARTMSSPQQSSAKARASLSSSLPSRTTARYCCAACINGSRSQGRSFDRSDISRDGDAMVPIWLSSSSRTVMAASRSAKKRAPACRSCQCASESCTGLRSQEAAPPASRLEIHVQASWRRFASGPTLRRPRRRTPLAILGRGKRGERISADGSRFRCPMSSTHLARDSMVALLSAHRA